MPLKMVYTYPDPEMVHVGAFTTNEGAHDVAQKGSSFYHFTNDPRKPPLDRDFGRGMPNVRSAEIFREGDSVTYQLKLGDPPSSDTMTKVASALPADMRKKKFVIKKAVEPAKL